VLMIISFGFESYFFSSNARRQVASKVFTADMLSANC
jgi:hypothetical protein